MPPTTRKKKPAAARPAPEPKELEEPEELEEEEEEAPPAQVRRLSTVHLDLDAEASEEEGEPFTFTLGGQDWSVPKPGVAQTLDAEQAPFLSDFFEIVMGHELWEEFQPVFRKQRDPDLTWKLGRGMSRFFGMDPASMQDKVEAQDKAEGNRAERRARGRGRPAPRRR